MAPSPGAAGCCFDRFCLSPPTLTSHTCSKRLRSLCTRSEWSRQGDSRSRGVSPR
ncbi:TPA: hypothetical protein MFM50_005162 [Klebsiella pneumoniae]|nr:hypothetical protein [Klebsiella pneumoniae]